MARKEPHKNGDQVSGFPWCAVRTKRTTIQTARQTQNTMAKTMMATSKRCSTAGSRASAWLKRVNQHALPFEQGSLLSAPRGEDPSKRAWIDCRRITCAPFSRCFSASPPTIPVDRAVFSTRPIVFQLTGTVSDQHEEKMKSTTLSQMGESSSPLHLDVVQ